MQKLILASQSPRRQELLQLCGTPFEVIVADIDESINTEKPLDEEIERLATTKAKTILMQHPEAIIVGADTIVTIDQKVLGKPKTPEIAFEMLSQLQNRTHHVLTGYAVMSNSLQYTGIVKTEVTFKPMSKQDILDYIATNEPMDKAGAYGIQGIGSLYIESIKGDYYAVMGLPVSKIYELLKNF